MIAPGSTIWFVRHELRLAWRDWVAMMTAGKRARRRAVLIGIVGFVAFMHAVAWFVVGSFAVAPPDQHMLIVITATLLLSWLLMISQAMESLTRAFYARSDLDLILASPVAAYKIFAVRIGTVALSVATMALPLAAPFIDILAVRGGARWLGGYGVILAMGAAATAIAVTLTVALFRFVGARRTRFVAQIVAAIIGAAFVIGLQVAAILSYGSISRTSVLELGRAAAAGACPGERLLVTGTRRARRRRSACGRAGLQFRPARACGRRSRAALRRIRHHRRRRGGLAGEPCRPAQHLPPRLEQDD